MLITLLQIPSVLRIQSHSRAAIDYGGFPYVYLPFDPGKLSEATDLGDDRFELRLRTKAPTELGISVGEWLRQQSGAIGFMVTLTIFDGAVAVANVRYRGNRAIVRSAMGAVDCVLTIGSSSRPLDQWIGL